MFAAGVEVLGASHLKRAGVKNPLLAYWENIATSSADGNTHKYTDVLLLIGDEGHDAWSSLILLLCCQRLHTGLERQPWWMLENTSQ